MNTLRRGLDRNRIKWIAVVCMLLDHTAALLLPGGTALYYAFRFLGRVTAPVMLFFLTEGFRRTRDRRRYALRLLVFALVSQVPYALARRGTVLTLDFNMLFTLLLSFLALCALESGLKPQVKYLAACACCGLCYFCDWTLLAPAAVLGFYAAKGRKGRVAAVCAGLALAQLGMAALSVDSPGAFLWESYGLGGLLAIGLLLVYDGTPGARTGFSKWFFYAFYPAHLLLLWLIGTVFFSK